MTCAASGDLSILQSAGCSAFDGLSASERAFGHRDGVWRLWPLGPGCLEEIFKYLERIDSRDVDLSPGFRMEWESRAVVLAMCDEHCRL